MRCEYNFCCYGSLGEKRQKQKVYFDDTVKRHGIMGVVVFMMKIFLL